MLSNKKISYIKYLYIVYLLLYISYITLGPHFLTKYIKDDEISIVSSKEELAVRSIYLSYLSLLFNAYFFINIDKVDYTTNYTNWLMAFIVALIANIGFIAKWLFTDNPYYWTGIISHLLSSLPIFITFFIYFYKNKNYYRFHKLSIIILLIALIIYLPAQYYIYSV